MDITEDERKVLLIALQDFIDACKYHFEGDEYSYTDDNKRVAEYLFKEFDNE